MRAKAITILLLIGLLLAATVACASATPPAKTEGSRPAVAPQAPAADSFGGKASESVANQGAPQLTQSQEASARQQMIIRTGNLSLVVANTSAAVERIQGIVNGLGGYIVSSNAWQDGEQMRAKMSVQVPSASFDQAMQQLKAVATNVPRDETTSQDVSEAYADLGARLTNLEATEVELRELLTATRERTGKAEDVLAIYRELTNIRSQIEQIKGRMQYYERATDMSTINLDIVPDALSKPIVVAGWRPSETVSNALRRLVGTLQGLVDAVIWVVLYVVPVLLLMALPLLFLIWVVRRLNRNRPAPKAEGIPEAK